MLFCLSCKSHSNEDDVNSNPIIESVIDTISNDHNHQFIDPEEREISLSDVNNQPDSNAVNTDSWSIDDFIIDCPAYYLTELKMQIKQEREHWENVQNPLIAVYKGNDFGDYHHINFEDANGKNYDFGFGNNDYGDLVLFDEEQLDDNPEYLGQSFLLFWEWKIATFPCCSGDYEVAEAYLPSIVKLELDKN
jgi:hypothetical protein